MLANACAQVQCGWKSLVALGTPHIRAAGTMLSAGSGPRYQTQSHTCWQVPLPRTISWPKPRYGSQWVHSCLQEKAGTVPVMFWFLACSGKVWLSFSSWFIISLYKGGQVLHGKCTSKAESEVPLSVACRFIFIWLLKKACKQIQTLIGFMEHLEQRAVVESKQEEACQEGA